MTTTFIEPACLAALIHLEIDKEISKVAANDTKQSNKQLEKVYMPVAKG